MALIDDISKKFSDVGQMTKDIAGVAKYNSMIIEEEKQAGATYEKIGRIYVELFGDEAPDNLKELVASVRESETKISEYKETVRSLKGVAVCEKCGAEIPKGSMFCSVCGEKVPEPDDGKVACKKCGARVEKTSKFCTVCGNRME